VLSVPPYAVAAEAPRAFGRVAHNSQPAACDASALVPPGNAVMGTTAAASISAAAAELAAMGVDSQFDVPVSASPAPPPLQAQDSNADSPAASLRLLAGVDAMYAHYRRDLVAVLSNVAWQRSRRLPLEEAGGGGLTEALLTHCAGDAYSPFVREWAIYGACLRATWPLASVRLRARCLPLLRPGLAPGRAIRGHADPHRAHPQSRLMRTALF
jgi:hypothetical protein